MTDQTFLTLNDGRLMPQVGLGVWQSPAETTADTVATALAAGYLAIDTAAAYRNEPGVGEGVKRSGVARDKLFVTTKLWNENQGYDAALAAFDKSLSRLGMDYVDLYLIHWPAPTQNLYLESWKALIRLREEGRAKSIGVSNFAIPHLERIIGETGVTPAANQIELHPRWQQAELRAFHASKGIATTSWSPLGQGRLLDDPVIGQIAAKHGKTPAQVIIRWHVDLGLTVIPKSVTPARIVANFQVFDFALDAEDLKAIAGLQAADGRIGPDPNAFG
ncbi:MAG: aldo/keto reductase [Pseudomonadota bacterium]